MDTIENQTYYHIQRQNFWNVGETYFIGKEKNTFCSFFDTFNITIPDPSTGKFYILNSISDSMVNFINGGTKNPVYVKFFSYDSNETVKLLNDALSHYLKFVRENIFEEVRKDFFPNLPSRQRCMWVIPNDKAAIINWWNLLGKRGRILELQLTGKIHRASEQYLSLTTNSFNFIREEAFKYWSSMSGHDIIRDECLFEGFAKVISEKNISDFT